ncbi:MAG TPA: ribosome biogenesis GTP-binding protein YihA/YsxC [Casimicrobiaceae bacterium]
MKKHAIVTDRANLPGADAARAPRPLLGATFEGAAVSAAQLPTDGIAEIAFAGRSNTGKSSAINALARQRGLAFASRTPGRTQQLNFFRLRGAGRVVDLPGYGYAAVSKDVKREWQTFLWDYVTTRATLVGLVLIVDARHGIKPLDRQILQGFGASSRSLLVLATKSDKLNVSQRRDAVMDIRAAMRDMGFGDAIDVVAFSATTPLGIAEADRVLQSWLPEADNDRKRPRDQGE